MSDKLEYLPMIPLRGLQVFPELVLNFDLERPFSIAAMNAAMEGDRRVFLTCQSDPEAEMPEEADPKSAVEEVVISDVGLKDALLKLKESERTVVSMKILSDMTFQEIADALSVPLGTVTWRYKNALEKLRRYGYE